MIVLCGWLIPGVLFYVLFLLWAKFFTDKTITLYDLIFAFFIAFLPICNIIVLFLLVYLLMDKAHAEFMNWSDKIDIF